MTLDLTKGICETEGYKAWKFPGGEVHIKIYENQIEYFNQYPNENISIKVRLNTTDDILLLMLVVDTLKKDTKNKLNLFIPYMPYQQADINFGVGECFSLKTITNLINSMGFDKVEVFDSHSIVTPGLLNNCSVIDNSDFINRVLRDMEDNGYINSYMTNKIDNLVLISPDSGAFKKIFKLREKLGLKKCDIITCSKNRDHETGEITTVVPKFDENKTVLIVDDICLAGNTFFNIRKEIPNKNVFLAVSHGIFNDNVDKLEKQFSKVYTTNSRRDESVGENIQVIKIF